MDAVILLSPKMPSRCLVPERRKYQLNRSSGVYNVKFPRHDGSEVSLTGVCLSSVTEKIPTYPLEDVEKEINKAFKASGGDNNTLPKLPASIGGEVHMMIGIKYLRYHPTMKFQMVSSVDLTRISLSSTKTSNQQHQPSSQTNTEK